MNKNKLLIISLIVLVLFCMATSFNSLAYFDLLTSLDDNSLSSGEWDYGMSVLTYYTGFEDATKTAYLAGDITTYGKPWHLNDALIGTLASDQKYDNRSVRLRNGYIETLFSVENLRIMNFYAGTFGTDLSGDMGIYLSNNQVNWSLYQTTTITADFDNYQIYFEESVLNSLFLSRTDELYIRFTYNNGNNRVNIDEVNISYVEDPNMEIELFEDFDTGTKGNYNNDIISLNNLNWAFNSALLGNQNKDRKFGTQSARIKNGNISSEFKIANIYEISFYLARYGNDAAATVSVEVSEDKINWYTISPLYSSTQTLTQHTIIVNDALLAPYGLTSGDALHIRIRSDSKNRSNVDNLSIKYIGSASLIEG